MAAIHPIPVHGSLKAIYPASEVSSAKKRYGTIAEKFSEVYSKKPDFFVRSPGRVNLIGEHIDYSGYGVLPMAIEQDIVIAVSVSPSDPHITLRNLREEDFPERKFLKKNSEVHIDNTKHDWGNYFLAGYKGVLESLMKGKEEVGMELLVDGTIPPGSGLSSSSALVCACALAATYANSLSKATDLSELAEICCRSERYIGMQGGGMDQATSLLAKANGAKLIEFNPLRTHDVSLPHGGSFVITNSLVESTKYLTAGSNFNKRVGECRLAAACLAKKLNLQFPEGTVMKLIEVQQKAGADLAQMIHYVEQFLHPQPYTREEVANILGIQVSELNSTYLATGKDIEGNSFKLHDRARHVFAEAKRVHDFNHLCSPPSSSSSLTLTPTSHLDSLRALGQLMNESHFSCSQLYECSCPELDQLTQICRNAGATGSRLTGAGWGGCVVSLVETHRVAEFCLQVQKEYYTPNGLKAEGAIFVSLPGSGAAVFKSD